MECFILTLIPEWSLFWQRPYVYVAAADNGFHRQCGRSQQSRVGNGTSLTPLRAASIYAMGNQIFVGAAEGSELEISDISDPVNPQPIGGVATLWSMKKYSSSVSLRNGW